MKCELCTKEKDGETMAVIFGREICRQCQSLMASISPEDVVYDYFVRFIADGVRSCLTTYDM